MSTRGGKVNVSPRPRNGRFKDGTAVRYSCELNYELRGVKKRRCQGNRWIPSIQQKTKCLPTGCGGLPLTNAVALLSHRGPVYPFGATVNYTCKKCAHLTGPSQLVCNVTGDWHPQRMSPYCKSQCPCSRPPQPSLSGGTSTLRSDERQTFHAGFRVNYTCPAGFGLDGVPYRICQKNGAWYPYTNRHKCISKLATQL